MKRPQVAAEHHLSVAASSETLGIVALVGDVPAVSKTFAVDQLLGLLRTGHRVRVVAAPPLEGHGQVPEELEGLLHYRNPPDRPIPGNVRRLVGAVTRSVRGTVAVLGS